MKLIKPRIYMLEKGNWIRTKQSGIIKYNPEYCQLDQIVEKWTPKEDEWCWFWNNDGLEMKQLLNTRSYWKGFYYTKKPGVTLIKKKILTTHYFEFCEPFFGELPTNY